MQGIVALASRFALPILLLAQVELSLALAYQSNSTKGDEKKAAYHPLQRVGENILTRIPLLSVIRLITYLASFPGESLMILWASYAMEFSIALILFLVSTASLVYFIAAKETSLRDVSIRPLASLFSNDSNIKPQGPSLSFLSSYSLRPSAPV